jgi:predicted Zn-dependent protease
MNNTTLESYALARLAYLYYSRDCLTEAERLFAGLVTLYPDAAYGWYGLGLIARHRNEIPNALARLQHALKLDPHLTDARLALGELLLRNRQPREAREVLGPLAAAGHPRATVLLARW